MKALEQSKLETLIVFRACCPLVVCLLDAAFMDRQMPSARSTISLLLLMAGAYAYVRTDHEFNLHGFAAYSWVRGTGGDCAAEWPVLSLPLSRMRRRGVRPVPVRAVTGRGAVSAMG